MRKFAWKNVRNIKENAEETISLLEFSDDNRVLFWASIRLFPTSEQKYEFVAFDKNRILKYSIPNADSVKEAQESIILFMKENGIISEEDVVE